MILIFDQMKDLKMSLMSGPGLILLIFYLNLNWLDHIVQKEIQVVCCWITVVGLLWAQCWPVWVTVVRLTESTGVAYLVSVISGHGTNSFYFCFGRLVKTTVHFGRHWSFCATTDAPVLDFVAYVELLRLFQNMFWTIPKPISDFKTTFASRSALK